MSQTRGLAWTKTNAEYLSHMKPVSVFSGSKQGWESDSRDFDISSWGTIMSSMSVN